jgi:hypothetical protein
MKNKYSDKEHKNKVQNEGLLNKDKKNENPYYDGY